MGVTSFTETLENRVLMSVSPASASLSLQVQMDRLVVREDLLKFRLDCVSGTLTMLTDINTIRRHDVSQATTILPLIGELHADVHHMDAALLADRLTEAQNVLMDESTIVGDLKHCLADKGTSAETADKAKLLADRIKLQDDMIAGLNSRIATRQADYTTIFADANLITTAVQNDSNASAPLQTAVQKWISDKTTHMDAMSTDLQTLVAARTQLVTDLTAMQST